MEVWIAFEVGVLVGNFLGMFAIGLMIMTKNKITINRRYELKGREG